MMQATKSILGGVEYKVLDQHVKFQTAAIVKFVKRCFLEFPMMTFSIIVVTTFFIGLVNPSSPVPCTGTVAQW